METSVNPFPNPDDVHNLALCGWREAEGEGLLGVRAVMHVCVNRVGALGFAKDLHDVLYGRNQFTSMSVPTDRRYGAFPTLGNGFWSAIVAVAPAVITGDDPDPTTNPQNGLKAHYYANLKVTSNVWFLKHIVGDPENHQMTTVIGRHTFFV